MIHNSILYMTELFIFLILMILILKEKNKHNS